MVNLKKVLIMFSLFLTVLISGQPVTNTIDNVTFNSIQECNNYKMAMNYHNSNHLTFKCGKTKLTTLGISHEGLD